MAGQRPGLRNEIVRFLHKNVRSVHSADRLPRGIFWKSLEKNAMLTVRQNLLSSFRKEQPDWIPWISLARGVNTPCFVPDEIRRSNDPLAVNRFLQAELGADILADVSPVQISRPTAKVRSFDEGDARVTEIAIGGRTLRTVRRSQPFGRESVSAIVEYPVKTEADLETFGLYMDDAVCSVSGSVFDEQQRALGEDGVVQVHAPRTPLMQLLIEHMGLEAFVAAYMDCRNALEKLMRRMDRVNEEIIRQVAATHCEVVGIYEDATTNLTSPQMYATYGAESLARYAEVLHDAGKIVMVHTCGHIRELLGLLEKSGVDALHYLNEPPLGNTPIAYARSVWGERVTIMASLNSVLLVEGTAEQIAANVDHVFDAAGSDRAFMVMSSGKPDIPERNLRALAEKMRERKSSVAAR